MLGPHAEGLHGAAILVEDLVAELVQRRFVGDHAGVQIPLRTRVVSSSIDESC